jgi:hypothetical protein
LAKAGVRVTLGRSKEGSRITIERLGPQGGSVEPAPETLPFPASPPHRQIGKTGIFDAGGVLVAGDEWRPRSAADYADFAGLAQVAA